MTSLIQGSPEWHALRKDKIGGSDAPVIMEVSPWTTPYQLWQQKLGIKPAPEANEYMRRGLALESAARAEFSELTGILVAPEVVLHPTMTWMMASLDGKEVGGENIVEIKCPGEGDHCLAKTGAVPEKYYPQLQHQMAVCEVDTCHYFSYYILSDGTVDTCINIISRNEAYIKNMIKAEELFMTCLEELTPPKLTPKDIVYRDDAFWQIASSQWLQVSSKMKELEEQEKELRATLISMSNGENTQGNGVRVCKFIRKGSVDYAKIPELKEVNLEPYRKNPVECWKITQVQD